MKVTQIASIMNAVNPEIIGVNKDAQTGAITPIVATVAEDGSNMLDAGKQIADWLTSDNVNTYMKAIMDKVGETIFISDEYDLGEEFDIRKTSLEAGSITEMIFFHDGEWTANTSWDEIISGTETAAPTFDEMFGYHPVTGSAVYFNRKATIASEVYTDTHLQLKSAFRSLSGIITFFNGVEQRWKNKLMQIKRKLKKMQVAAWAADKVYANSGVFNLLGIYNSEQSAQLKISKTTALHDPDFLRWAKAYIEILRENLRERTALYNPEGYVGAVPRTRQKALLYAPFAEYLAVNLYSGTFHDDYVKLGGFDNVAYWQAEGGMNDDLKMQINLKTPNHTTAAIVVNGLLGVIFDDRAIFQVDEYARTVVQPNNMSEWNNVQHKLDVSLYYTTALNGVVLLLDDYDYAAAPSEAASAPSNWATLISSGIYTMGADGTYTKVASGATWTKGTRYFTKNN